MGGWGPMFGSPKLGQSPKKTFFFTPSLTEFGGRQRELDCIWRLLSLHSVSICHTRSIGVKYILIQLEFTSDASPVTTACSLFHSRAEVLATVNISFDVYLYLEKASWSKFKKNVVLRIY